MGLCYLLYLLDIKQNIYLIQFYIHKSRRYTDPLFLVLVYVDKQRIYLLSAIDVSKVHIDYIYIYSKYQNSSSGYSLLLLYLLYFSNNLLHFTIDLLSINLKSLSLYMWLGYSIIQQRKNYFKSRSGYGITLKNSKVKSKNFLRRYTILKYF
jgi:ribosomal protein S18 acetylase RimI-like enzyme